MYSPNNHHYSAKGGAEKPYRGANLSWCAARRCVFLSGTFNKGIGASGQKTCDYILKTGHPRPCPAGEGCTVCTSSRKALEVIKGCC